MADLRWGAILVSLTASGCVVGPGGTVSGDIASGDSTTAAGDMRLGDTATGDTYVSTGDVATGDSATGDAATGDSANGDVATGDSATGDAATGDSATGDAATGDTANGDARSGGDFTQPAVFLQRSGTELSRGGAPFKAIAMNKVDLFWQFLGVASGVSAAITRPQALTAMDDAVAAGVCCMRVASVGFYPINMNTWATDPTAHWAAHDDMIAELRARGLKIIPVIWWNTWTFADMAGEPLHDTFMQGTNSHQLLLDYTTQLVSRYVTSDTVLFWELTNEINLGADLDNGLRPTAGINPPGGTPAARTSADNYATDEMTALMVEMANLIGSVDSNHLISAGYSSPRTSAWHLRAQPEWSAGGPDWTADSVGEMGLYVAATNPDPIGLVSVHYYDDPRFGLPGSPSPDQLPYFLAAADAIGKPLFVGEFGDSNPTVSVAREANFTRRVMLKVLELRIPLSLIWTWEFYQFSPTQPSPHSIEPGVDDALIAIYSEVDGWLQAASTSRGAELSLQNGSFEVDGDGNTVPDGWETVWRNGTSTGSSAIQYVNASDAFLGNTTLRLNSGAGDPGSYVFALSDPVLVGGGDQVIVSAALRHNLSAGASAYLTLVEYDAVGTEIGIRQRVFGPLGGWRLTVEYFRVQLGAQTRSVRVRLGVGGADSMLMDVDDVRISRVD